MRPQLISEYDAIQLFEEMLDDTNPMVKVGYLSFMPSTVLRELDPVAYREDFIQYCDCLVDSDIYVEDYTEDQMEPEEQEAD